MEMMESANRRAEYNSYGSFLCFLQIEELGSEGRVEEAQGMMKLVEQLKEERELLSSTPSVSSL